MLITVPKEVLIAQYSANNENKTSTRSSQFYSDDYENLNDDDDPDMKAAIEASLKHDTEAIMKDNSFQNAIKTSENEFMEQEDDELKRAIELSLQNEIKPIEEPEKKDDPNEIRRKRLEYLDKLQNKHE